MVPALCMRCPLRLFEMHVLVLKVTAGCVSDCVCMVIYAAVARMRIFIKNTVDNGPQESAPVRK